MGLGGRIAAALMTSALGITVANPADVVKVGALQEMSRREMVSDAESPLVCLKRRLMHAAASRVLASSCVAFCAGHQQGLRG